MKRRLRFAVMSMYLATGAILLQISPVCSMAGSVATAGAANGDGTNPGALVDNNGNFLGLPGVNVCGVQNIRIIDNTTGLAGNVLNFEDDLVVGCPVSIIRQTDTTGTGGGG